MTTAVEHKEAQPETTRTVPTVSPATDVVERDSEIVVIADMPGVDEKHVEVTLENNVLTIRGQAFYEAPAQMDGSHEEFRARDYERAFTIREEVDREKIRATMKNGVLRVTLPRSAETAPRRINVTSG